jgi:hypothetical protein
MKKALGLVSKMKNKKARNSFMKHMFTMLLSMVFVVVNLSLFYKVVAKDITGEEFAQVIYTGNNWVDTPVSQTESTEFITYEEYRTTICTEEEADPSVCDLTDDNMKIRFDTADELYEFSVDVSFDLKNIGEAVKLSEAKIEILLDQDYVLGQDIDYSVMKSKAFIPIGYLFSDTINNSHQRYFTGSFDGQGFSISNLYMSAYEYMIFEDTNNPETVYIPISEYYAMFNYNAGTIKNISFVDMYIELTQVNTDLTKLANVVGYNMPDPEAWNGTDFGTSYGSVENISVIDTRTNVREAGLRYIVGTSSADFEAAGIVHTNSGNVSNSYFVSKVVVSANFINKFDLEPVLFDNTGGVIIDFGEPTQQTVNVTGTYSNLYYDEDVYLIDIDVNGDFVTDVTINTPNALAEGVTTYELKNDASTPLFTSGIWYFYPDDGYPILQGLPYVTGVYQISDAVDLAFFSELLNKESVLNGLPFNYSSYALTNSIDMTVLAPSSYKVPTKVFYGDFSGFNPLATDLSENYYIFGMDIVDNVTVNNEHFSGLFSRLGAGAEVSDLNFTQSTLEFSGTEDIYTYTFYMGAIAGKMTNATVQNVLVDVTYNLGNEAIGKTYLGGIAGKASGNLNQVASNGSIDLDSHSYESTQSIQADFYIGGIVGASHDDSQLRIIEATNNSTITGFSTSSDIVLASGHTAINVYIGGIIGYLKNTSVAIHDMVNVANNGDINVMDVKERAEVQGYQYVGGVFGMLEGLAPVLEDNLGEYRFANLYNEGDIYSEFEDSTSQISAAGIGTSNTDEDVEYALIYNYGTFIYDSTNFVVDNEFQGATDLFISEYGEGDNYNRWIEIYNGTNSSINLSEYSLKYALNGGAWDEANEYNLSGTINPDDVHMVADIDAASTILNFADQTHPWWKFNGNDAVGLFKNGVLIDIFGVYGQDPGTGWTVDGITNATQNHVLIRKSNSYQPTTVWNPSDWLVYDNNYFSFLGFHDTDIDFNISSISFDSFMFTSTIFDVSESEIQVTLTRNYNYASHNFDSFIYSYISPFSFSTNNNDTLIRYSSNFGDINFLKPDFSVLEARSDISIAAITNNTNVNYHNVHNHGNINVVSLDMGVYSLYIAGFSKTLSVDQHIENSLNDGNIIFADIEGTGNIYVSGFVNFNNAGDLQDGGQSPTQPIATEGIINSINSGNISTTYSPSRYGVDGLGNTFVGGLATLNKGSIQNSANLGNITLYNTQTTATSFSFESSQNLAGLSISYTGGIIAGGVSSMVIDGNSRIYDSSNNGNVFVKAYRFARAGGVLGVSLHRESTAGGITSEMGLVDNIQNSILSNGLNFGNISTITNERADYSGSSYTSNQDLYISETNADPDISGTTNAGTELRPPVYASAGGVIGYGLSEMKNMLNHGIISSTDVAGGVVGATYVLGDQTTVVDISTAVNYGVLEAISNSSYGSIDGANLTSATIAAYYLTGSTRQNFLFPSLASREFSMTKPGFGGIFGRLQRGLNGVMTSENGAFDFIVNADPNIDLIGRLDQVQNFSSSLRFFRFVGAKYYSARPNDTTLGVFAGFLYSSTSTVSVRVEDVNYLGYTQSGSTYTHNFEIIYRDNGSYTIYWERGNSSEAVTYFNEYIQINTSSSAQPSSGYTVGTQRTKGNDYYLGVKNIPWITENPSDPRLTEDFNDPSLEAYEEREYIYGPYFPMRTDPNLTEYIYFAEYDLLADRFRQVADGGTGTNVRNNGMYVLSTTAGQSFGSVLPRNIDINQMEAIDEEVANIEDLSLLDFNLTDIPPEFTMNLDANIITKYQELYQTRFNDKAELTDSELQNFMLMENEGSYTILNLNAGSPISYIDFNNNTVYFTISLEAYASSQTTVSYRIFDALASSNALLAIRPQDYQTLNPGATLADLSNDLYDERLDEISVEDAAILEVNLPTNRTVTTQVSLGYFSVYSEAFVNDDIFADTDYYNDYEIIITFTPQGSSSSQVTGIEFVSFNGGANINPGGFVDPQPAQLDLRDDGDVNYNGSLTLYFLDEKGIMTEGYDFKNYFKLYYMDGITEVEVNKLYYSISSVPINASGDYSITFDFSNKLLKAGDYRLKYSYFQASFVYQVQFDKSPSSENSISELSYYSMGSLQINTNAISSTINMGKVPKIDGTTSNFTDNLNVSLPVYLSNHNYDISFMDDDSFVISAFASVTRAQLISSVYSSGYLTYTIEYDVEAENGTTKTYTHTITETAVQIDAIFKNENEVPIESIETSREAFTTKFEVDLGFDQSAETTKMGGPVTYKLDDSTYPYISIAVTGVDPDLVAYAPAEIVGLTYAGNSFLVINMSKDTLPGTYTFTITYHRDATNSIGFTPFDIVKNEGVYAYLGNIKFTPIEVEGSYPDIAQSDEFGGDVPVEYNVAAYYFGIDYDGADLAGYEYFKVLGRVSNIPLESYYPYMTDYLPLGATVAREITPGNYTAEVGKDATDQEKAVLAADFTEVVGDENIAIKYRVTSEDGLNQVYYFVTVNDILYNLTLSFDIYYCSGSPEVCVPASEAPEFTEVIQIKAYSLDIYSGDYTLPSFDPEDPLDYPEFTHIAAMHNTMSQFIYTDGTADYSYRFGRNRSGFYIFEVVLPRDEYLNELYTYEISFNSGTYTLPDISTLTFECERDLEGKYFYILPSEVNRSRSFDIYIRKSTEAKTYPFGLFDFLRSWGG